MLFIEYSHAILCKKLRLLKDNDFSAFTPEFIQDRPNILDEAGQSPTRGAVRDCEIARLLHNECLLYYSNNILHNNFVMLNG